MKFTTVQCLLFVLDKSPEQFVLIPSRAVEKHSNVCELFTRADVKILEKNEEYPILQEALRLDQAQVVELVVTCCVKYIINDNEEFYQDFKSTRSDTPIFVQECTYPSESLPFIPVSVEVGNEDLVMQLFPAVILMNDVDEEEYHLYPPERLSIDDGNLEILARFLTFRVDIRFRTLGGTLLHFAIRRQNESLIQLLFKYGVNVNAVDNEGSAALYFAVRKKSLSIISLLLEKGAAVNLQNKKGTTCLFLAVHVLHGSFELVELLLKNGANVNISNNNGVTPLHKAASFGDVPIMNKLLEHGADVNATVSYHHAKGVTPLCLAMERGHLAAVNRLLEKGADPTILCYNDRTILELAIELERVSIIECIFKHHPNLSSNNIVRCKDSFYEQNFRKMKKLLNKLEFRIDYFSPLHDAISKNDCAAVTRLLGSENVNKVYYFRHPYGGFKQAMPLFVAIAFGANDVVKLLISRGADPRAKLNFDYDETPWSPVMQLENVEVAMLLLAEGVEIPDRMKLKIILMAIKQDSPELLEEVLRKSSKLKVDLALVIAAKSSAKLIQVPLKFGACINYRETDGKTALHGASSSVHDDGPKVIRCLIQNNADVNARDNAGLTPISAVSERHSKLKTVIELLKYGARFDVTDNLGVSPFQRVLFLTREDILKAFLCFHFTDPQFALWTDFYQLFKLSHIQSLRDSKDSPLYFLYSRYHNNFGGDRRRKLENFSETLLRHMVQLKAAYPHKNDIFDFCSQSNLRSVANGDYLLPPGRSEKRVWLDLRKQCEEEIEQLKTKNVGSSRVSYYDLLTKSEHKVSCYLRKTGRGKSTILRTLESKKYKTKFPIYGDILSCQLERGSLRRKLLDPCLKQCHLLVGVFKDLPKELKEEVLSFLNNAELEVAVHACKCITDRQ